ncbi:hypothetical protein OROMI_026463 [Orobanche minor]
MEYITGVIVGTDGVPHKFYGALWIGSGRRLFDKPSDEYLDLMKECLGRFSCPYYGKVHLSLPFSPRIISVIAKFKPHIIHAPSLGIMGFKTPSEAIESLTLSCIPKIWRYGGDLWSPASYPLHLLLLFPIPVTCLEIRLRKCYIEEILNFYQVSVHQLLKSLSLLQKLQKPTISESEKDPDCKEICGWGVVAAESISKGDFVVEYAGEDQSLENKADAREETFKKQLRERHP